MLFLFFFIAFADCFSISSINSSNLTFTAEKKLLSCSNLPPVTIYSCFLSKFPSENINNRTNDANLQWIGTTKSSFEAEFGQIKPAKFAFLQLENVDTIGEIIWNGAKIGNVRNSFRKYLFDVSKTINPTNQLQIDLQAPVIAAKQAAEAQYPIKQYPECPVSAQTNGQCHVNMLRKPQYSFSWDWGPSMPDSGIYDSPKLLVFDSSAIFDAKLQLLSAFSDDLQILQVQVLILHPNSESAPAGQAIVNFKPALKFSEDAMKFEKVDENLWKGTMNLQIEREEINWWWIHGMGKQNLYTATITWDSSSSEISSIEKQFGFRTAELVQDQLQDGLSFYFKINEKPTFMSGSNWIPSSSYIGDFSDYYADNLQSAVDAGIKMLRVWGGGIYEQDAFYSKANELGLLIWQDFTFACSTYENDDAFLDSVAKEVSDQIWRLSSNPSIVAWAGNNENEAALATNWWSIPDEEMDFYYKQYSDLYINTAQKTILSEGLTVPFVLSSPSNGKMSENSPNGIAKNPYDPNFGDVHFYDYKSDCTDWTKFPKTRFASEFGYQSVAKIYEKCFRMDFWDCTGIFLIFSGFKILLAQKYDLYHSTDFDVHRNWLAITNSKPISEWYFENTSEWTLDYPPFFAYFEKLLSKYAAKYDPLLVKIQKDPISTDNVVFFQKMTVVFTDITVLFGAYFFCKSFNSRKNNLEVAFLISCNAALFIIDHIHFQYNGLILGLLLCFLAAFMNGKLKTAALVFSFLLHLKHLFLYVAPFAGIAFLQQINSTRIRRGIKTAFLKLAFIASIVLFVSAASLFPFLSQLDQLAARLFPFKRGLTHSYWAGNFWAIYNFVDLLLARLFGMKSALTSGLVGEFSHQVLPNVPPLATFSLTFASMIPALVKIWTKPERKTWILSFCSIALSSFIFGWHVHEKAILLALLPASGFMLLEKSLFRVFGILMVAGVSGVLPLIFTEFEQSIVIPVYILYLLTTLYIFQPDFQRMNIIEKLYIISSVPLVAFVQIWSKVLLPSLPFLPLLVQSLYTALGVLYSFILINLELFSVDSWGLISSIESVTSSADRYFGSAWAAQRNHHQDGNEQIYGFITQFFGEQPWIKNQSEEAFKNFIYLSQTVQSICTSSQANFYRSRAGLQSTMGALYWQLNDVWSTASWSSLDYSKNWKPLHYQIKKNFNSELTLISKVNDNDQLEVFVISDYVATKGRLKVETRSWRSFDTLGEVDYGMFEIKQLEGNLILTKNVGFLLNQMNCPYGKWNECYFTISFITNDGLTLFTTWESPVPIREIKVFTELDANVAFFGDCSIDPKDQSLEFEISSALPQPFVWLETRYIGKWSDNFFMMTSSRSFLTFMPAYELTCEEFMKDAQIYYPSKVHW
ncbi:unnamed protein product [Oikopleura dioica]|uniref:beta-mannosidase n=1 Tax=Oikopleura dioica TaxID=34765 RepID=E4YHJ8_OIKDI|nr:unnamed protein product [Oikopleura dioica]